MSYKEENILMGAKKSGIPYTLYPVTKAENVLGLNEYIESNFEVGGATAYLELTIETESETDISNIEITITQGEALVLKESFGQASTRRFSLASNTEFTVSFGELDGFNGVPKDQTITTGVVNSIISKSVKYKLKSEIIIGNALEGHTLEDVDFLCDGTDDDVEINQAIALWDDTYERFYVKKGNYDIGNELVFDSLENVVFECEDDVVFKSKMVDTSTTSGERNGILKFISALNCSVIGGTYQSDGENCYGVFSLGTSDAYSQLDIRNASFAELAFAVYGLYASMNIDNCTCMKIGRSGMAMYYSVANVSNCTISDVTESHGIAYYYYPSTGKVTNCTITNIPSGNGVACYYTAIGVGVEKCDISNCENAGITFGGDTSGYVGAITGNKLIGNTLSINMGGSNHNVTITGNTWDKAPTNSAKSSTITITGNTLV